MYETANPLSIVLIKGDCTVEGSKIESGSVDLILTDLPYGTVKGMADGESLNHGMKGRTGWDLPIDSKIIHGIANRILRKNGKMVLFSQQPFTTNLINTQVSNLPFCYSMVWKKDHFANSLIAKKAPVNYYEDILVFNKSHDFEGIHPLRPYFKKVLDFIGVKKKDIIGRVGQGADHCFRVDSSQFSLCKEKTYLRLISDYNVDKMEGFKTFSELTKLDNLKATFNLWEGGKIKSNVLEYKKDYDGLHPTQKPTLLLEDLIKTFSNQGDLVVDLTMGSGSTGVACISTGRRFIGIEMDNHYFQVAESRLRAHQSQHDFLVKSLP